MSGSTHAKHVVVAGSETATRQLKEFPRELGYA
jgi:hypothetical protein